MLYHLKDTKIIVGAKQTLKCLEKDIVKVLFVAKDADDRVTCQSVKLAKEKDIQIEYVESMCELGRKCNIEVKTAIAAIIE